MSVSLLVLAALSPALAAEPDEIELVVITATKTATPLLETPQSISVVTAEEMAQRGVQDLDGALSYSSGIKFRDYPGSDGLQEFFLRGFRANASGESVFRDGLRQQFNGFDGNVEPYGLERIELLKGPASVLYGEGAPGGLVNLITKRPTADPLYEAEIQGGSFDRFQGAFDIGGPLTGDDTVLYRLTALGRDAKSQFDDSKDDRVYVAPALTWKPGPSTEITFLGQYLRTTTSSSEQSFPAEGTMLPNPNGKLPASLLLGDPDADRATTDSFAMGYVLHQGIADGLSFDQTLRYSWTDTDISTVYPFGGTLMADRLYDRGAQKRDDSSHQILVDSRLDYVFDTGEIQHNLLAGLDYSHNRRALGFYYGTIDSLDVFAPQYHLPIAWDPSFLISGRTGLDQTGVYVQEQMKYAGFVLALSGRNDWVTTRSDYFISGAPYLSAKQKDEAFTWRAGLVYVTDIGLAPYVSYSNSFIPSTSTYYDGRLFHPTQGKQIEAGVKYQPPGTSTSLTATVYQLTQTNVETPDTMHPGFTVQQGEVTSRGFEFEARTMLTDRLSLNAAYSYTDAKTTKANLDVFGVSAVGLRQLGVAAHTGSLWADYSFDGVLGGLSTGGGLHFSGPSYNIDNSLKTAGYALVDVALRYDIEKYRIALNVSNLFDTTYFNPGYYPDSVFYGYSRSILGTVSYRW